MRSTCSTIDSCDRKCKVTRILSKRDKNCLDKASDQLLKQTKQEDICTIVTRRRWIWIGHVLRMDNNNIAKTAMRWTPEGKRRRGRPKTTWRRTVEAELRELNYSWSTIEKLARDRQGWRNFVATLCATQA